MSSSHENLGTETGRPHLYFSGLNSHQSSVFNMINLHMLPICGREEEIGVIRDAYFRVRERGPSEIVRESGQTVLVRPSEVVLVSGESGSGKTALVEVALRDVVTTGDKAYFVRGKCDQLVNLGLCTALVDALTDLCGLIAQSSQRDSIRNALNEELGNEGMLLLGNLIPNLSQVCGLSAIPETSETPTPHDSSDAKYKLLVRKFLRVLSTQDCMVVMFIDDMQWMDQFSANLIESIISDPGSKNVLFVFAYRRDEARDEFETIRMSPLSTNDVFVSNLGLDSVGQLLLALTGLYGSALVPLTELIHNRTLGNLHILVQFLDLLQSKGLLVFSTENCSWEFDVGRIRTETNISDSVVSLIQGKIYRLSLRAQAVLQLASCFGHTFDSALLEEVVDVASTDDLVTALQPLPTRNLNHILAAAVKEHLIEKFSDEGYYKFSHDKIEQCLYEMIPSQEHYHLLIGRLVYGKLDLSLSSPLEDSDIFLAADQMNRGLNLITTDAERLHLTELDHLVAKRALSRMAFISSSHYIKAAVQMYPSSVWWEDHPSLALEVFSLAAEVTHCVADRDESARMVNEVLENADVPVRKKMRVYEIMFRSLFAQNKWKEALDLGSTVLRRLGVRFPSKVTMLSVVVEYVRVHRLLRGKSDEQILSLPLNRDEGSVQAMKLLSLMAIQAQIAMSNPPLLALCCLRIVRMTCRQGMCPFSIFGFAMYGVFQDMIAGKDEVFRFGRLSTLMLQQCGTREVVAQVTLVVHAMTWHRKRPLTESIEACKAAHKTGVSTGGEFALLCAGAAMTQMDNAGFPLLQVEEFASRLCEEMEILGQDQMLQVTLSYLQYYRNMMGPCEDPTAFEQGEAMERLRDLGTDNQNNFVVYAQSIFRLRLLYFFQKWTELEALLPILTKHHQGPTLESYLVYDFFLGMSYYALFRQTGKRRHRKAAERLTKKMERLLDSGNVNVHTRTCLLQAEHLVVQKAATDEIVRSYEMAIASAVETENRLLLGLSYEQVGSFLLGRNEMDLSLLFLARAVEAYISYGAQTKADFVDNKYAPYFN